MQNFPLAVAAVTTLAALAAIGCDSPTAPIAVDGSFPLTMINESPLPFTLGSLGIEVGDPPGQECVGRLSSGRLAMDEKKSTYMLEFSVVNSCYPSRPGTTITDVGTFERVRNQLVFRTPGIPGTGVYAGNVEPNRIVMQREILAFSFAR